MVKVPCGNPDCQEFATDDFIFCEKHAKEFEERHAKRLQLIPAYQQSIDRIAKTVGKDGETLLKETRELSRTLNQKVGGGAMHYEAHITVKAEPFPEIVEDFSSYCKTIGTKALFLNLQNPPGSVVPEHPQQLMLATMAQLEDDEAAHTWGTELADEVRLVGGYQIQRLKLESMLVEGP